MLLSEFNCPSAFTLNSRWLLDEAAGTQLFFKVRPLCAWCRTPCARSDVKAPRQSSRIGGAHYLARLAGFQGELAGAFEFGSNSVPADPETLSVFASFIVSARGL
jgi:hypothetical protein